MVDLIDILLQCNAARLMVSPCVFKRKKTDHKSTVGGAILHNCRNKNIWVYFTAQSYFPERTMGLFLIKITILLILFRSFFVKWKVQFP